VGSFFFGLPLARHFVSLNESHRPLNPTGFLWDFFIGLPLARHFVSLNEFHRPLNPTGLLWDFFYRFAAGAAFRFTQRVPSPAQSHRFTVGFFLSVCRWRSIFINILTRPDHKSPSPVREKTDEGDVYS
jgi:hypothetical protein